MESSDVIEDLLVELKQTGLDTVQYYVDGVTYTLGVLLIGETNLITFGVDISGIQ